MKKLIYLIVAIVALSLIVAGCGLLTAPPSEESELVNKTEDGCTTIQSGELFASDGSVITTGYDMWGYNYQAHQYIGYYGNYQRPPEPVDWGYRLMMKWNDAWLSNKDCDGDGLLDRHYGYDSYIGSGAWLTNHQSGEDVIDGEICKWTYFVKIIAAPVDAYAEGGFWYTADGIEIGPVIWGAFAIIEEVENDPCAGLHGAQYISPYDTGFGEYSPG